MIRGRPGPQACAGSTASRPCTSLAPADALEVWVDEAHTRTTRVPRLDTDASADSYETRLSLQVWVFDLGPELAWARRAGLERVGAPPGDG